MESCIVEKVFGGWHILEAFSKFDFFSQLETFLSDIYGPVSFTVLASGGGRGRLRVEFSTCLEHPPGKSEVWLAPEADLLEVLRPEEGYRAPPGGGPLLEVRGHRLPVVWVKPIRAGGRCFGWILFHQVQDPKKVEEDMPGIETFIFDHLSFAYYRLADRDQIEGDLDLCEAKLAAINGMGELVGSLDLDVLLTKLLELSLFIASAQVGSVVLQGEGGPESRVEWGLPLEVLRGLRSKDGRPILETALESGQPELIADFRAEGRCDGGEDFRVDSFLCIPLATKGKVLGAIDLINSSQDEGFTREERESLATISGLAATAIENALLHRDSLEKERITENLRIAQSIQTRMYPKACPEVHGYQMAWLHSSCDETGGDYFDFIPLDDSRMALVVGDVSGHGIGAALLMATGRANLRALFSVKRGVREAVEALDALLEGDMDAEKFMTLFVGDLDHRTHALSYLNAGHDPPLLFQKATGGVVDLPSTGLPLGVLGSASCHEEGGPVAIEPGDVLLLGTDGVWEEMNAEGERFGKKRLGEVFRRVAGASAQEIVEAIQAEVVAFTGGGPRKDDFTMIAVKREE